MLKKVNVLSVFILCLVLMMGFSGCATLRNKDLEAQSLRNQIQALEAQLSQKDSEIVSLRQALDEQGQEKEELAKKLVKTTGRAIGQETKSRPSIKQIQTALTNAGYNPGPIDGRMGKMTRDAIKAFQRANELRVDGRAGKRTWSLLKKYLYQKEK